MANTITAPKYRRKVANNDAAITISDDLTVSGDLIVSGTSTLTGTQTGAAPVNAAAATLAVTAAAHANRTVILDRAAGIAVTLPAATGTGNKYTFVVHTTFTGAATIKVANATDVMSGTAVLFADAGDTVVGFATTSTSDTIDMLGTGNSTGGIAGEIIELIDYKSGFWSVKLVSDAAGTEATPFSATVS